MARTSSPLRQPLDDAYLPLKALSAYAGLSVRTLRGYLTHVSRPLACYRIGGRVLVRRSDYDAWAVQFRDVAAPMTDALVEDAIMGLVR